MSPTLEKAREHELSAHELIDAMRELSVLYGPPLVLELYPSPDHRWCIREWGDDHRVDADRCIEDLLVRQLDRLTAARAGEESEQ